MKANGKLELIGDTLYLKQERGTIKLSTLLYEFLNKGVEIDIKEKPWEE